MRLIILMLVVIFTLMSLNGCGRKSKKAAEPAPVVVAPAPAAEPAKVETGSLMRSFKLVDDQGRESGSVVFNPMGGAELRNVDGTVIGIFTPPVEVEEPDVIKPAEMDTEENAPAADENAAAVDADAVAGEVKEQ